MREVFAVLYAVFFGAMLNAEIGWRLFKYNPAGLRPEARTCGGYLLRILLLVLCRGGFFAIAYPLLSIDLADHYGIAALQLIWALFLCVPVLGFQQLLYGLQPSSNPAKSEFSGTFSLLLVFISLVAGLTLLLCIFPLITQQPCLIPGCRDF